MVDDIAGRSWKPMERLGTSSVGNPRSTKVVSSSDGQTLQPDRRQALSGPNRKVRNIVDLRIGVINDHRTLAEIGPEEK